MNWLTFRTKIIGTLVLGITLFSVVSFTLYNIALKNKLISSSEENIEQINLLRDQFYFSINQHDGRIIRSVLKNMEKNKGVLGTYLVDSECKVIYPANYGALSNDTANFARLFAQNSNISIKTYRQSPTPYNRIFIRMQNTTSCYSCHKPAQKILGMIVLDLSNHETEKIISYTWKFGFIYTFLLLISIFSLVAFLHYRFIRRSLNQFRATITMINKGNLDIRLSIPEAKELGTLGKSFNEMLDTFVRTRNELDTFHEKELQNSQKLATIGEMSARIAHEIRNPITGIARALEIIIVDLKEDRNKAILEEIQRQANRVEQAISNLLKFSRANDVRMHEGDINEVIKSMVFFLTHQGHGKTVNFELNLQEPMPVLLFDHELVENVLLNLSFNAIKAISDNGMILYESRLEKENNRIVIAVRDNGTGIQDDVANEIFKPFFTTHTKGTGLGLAISKDIIEKHNGEIWFENNHDGGCTFFISLPVIRRNQYNK